MDKHKNIKDLVRVLNEAISLQRQGQNDEAEERYQQILTLEGHFRAAPADGNGHDQATIVNTIYSQVYNNLGLFRESENNLGQAITSFRNALDYAPGSVEAHTSLSRVFFKKRNLEKALESAKQAVSLQPDYLPGVIQLCRAAFVQEMPEVALEALEKIGPTGAKNARINIEYGRILEKLGRRREAKEKYEAALVLQPDSIYALWNMGNVNFHLAQYGEALKHYYRILELKPDYGDAHRNIGFVYQRMGRFNEAETAYHQALSANPGDMEAVANYASLKELQEDYEGAFDLADKVLKTPKLLQSIQFFALLIRAKCERNMGKPEVAVETAKEMVELTKIPDEIHRAYYELGYAYDDLGEEEEAFEYMGKANAEFLKTAHNFEDDEKSLAALLGNILDEDFSTMFPKDYGKAQVRNVVAPIFVVGNIQSGTQLLDQYFQDFEDFNVLQDAPFINGLRRRVAQEHGGYPAGLANVDMKETRRLRHIYFDLKNQFMPEIQGKAMWNSYPLNLLEIPLILKLFPQAKFVFLTCHPNDTVMNIYRQGFVQNETSSTFADLQKTGKFCAGVLKVWEKFKKEMPIEYIEVTYEALLDAPDREIKRILGFVDPDQRTGAISALKKPKDLKGLAADYREKYPPMRWKRYEKLLKPGLKAIQPFVKKFGY